MKLHTKLTIVLISSLFASSLVTAAEHGLKMNQPNPGMDCNSMGMMPGDMGMDPAARARKHLSELNTTLKLTKDQQPAWQTFSDQVNDQAKNMASMQDKMKDKTQAMAMTAPEHMAMMADKMEDRAENMEKMADAVKTFYAILTPEQQAAFDKIHTSHMTKMGHMHSMK